ncbi:nucleoside triphosphate pyrophosphohydrolase [uncultured Dubosiella sp.]|uniref:nucleoside triphosphate pyrophosphohydrolase n=1 Tax=uncultured Dubosiella sp. TaxID=1937011 RepID=UPI002589EAD4|nr:nucleoside triphosphate pyrophosphohydrolase [uncultured Dubosiella sp.]
MKKIHNKLVRDRIPEIIEEDGKTCKMHIMDEESYRHALKAKLLEEANEVKEAASKEELIKEMADVLEVLEALQKTFGIDIKEVERVKDKKALSNGKFERRIFLEYVEKE